MLITPELASGRAVELDDKEVGTRLSDFPTIEDLGDGTERVSYDIIGAEYERGRALLALGSVLQAADEERPASRAVADARTIFERLGAAVDLEAARQLEAALG